GLSNLYQVGNNKDVSNKEQYWVYQPAVGVGFRLSQLHVDYAFTSLNMQDNPLYTHVVSIKLNFTKRVKKAEDDIPADANENNSETRL
ncbi:MAG TPA: hypothetical protein VKZ76_04930, partial [Edaphocola sp.]|nr:hypothetical protein [Edaphocola sp.]